MTTATEKKCSCCKYYGRPGQILNAGQWMSCPQCNRKHVKAGEYDKSNRAVKSK